MAKHEASPEKHEHEHAPPAFDSHRHVTLGLGEKLHVHIPDPNPSEAAQPQQVCYFAAEPPAAKKDGMFQHIMTDYDNETFDTGRVIVVFVGIIVLLVTLAMTAVAGLQVYNSPEVKFDFLNFGGGVAALLGGFSTLLGAFAVYISQDAKNKPPAPIPPLVPVPTPTPISASPPLTPVPVKKPVVIPN